MVDGEYVLQEEDLEVRPEALPSALLDCRVSLPKLKKYFSPDAWSLLNSSGKQITTYFKFSFLAFSEALLFLFLLTVAVKKQNKLWTCSLCKEKDDGKITMVSCDQCLEWFHW